MTEKSETAKKRSGRGVPRASQFEMKIDTKFAPQDQTDGKPLTCTTDTTLKAGETLDMPVVFYVDPAIVDVPELKDVKTITLSYTMFPIDGDKPVAAADKAAATGASTTPDSKLGG